MLFEIPTEFNHGPLAPPKCKSKTARTAAFELLSQLGRTAVPLYRQLLALILKEQYKQGNVKRTQWHYAPQQQAKCAYGYVGLKNLGATCYMNSLMQQFFMIPSFRYAILGTKDNNNANANANGINDVDIKIATTTTEGESNRNESVLFQLQQLFCYLQESEKKFFDPREFCLAYKDYEGNPMNPSIQMDVDEFFNRLFDKLETQLKETPEKNILQTFFGGKLLNQLICKDCPHVSEREETFYTLSLEVKGKKNILESLDSYVQGEILEGDNKYFCEICSRHVDAVKRCCIKTLPETLIIHLKRFEFDFDRMRKVKVNDSCEFPMRLDIEPYTKEGLAKREANDTDNHTSNSTKTETEPSTTNKDSNLLEEAQTASASPPPPPDFYEYELTGVLVHTGTADSGHYYSFIRESSSNSTNQQAASRWLEFNDSEVLSFDFNSLPDEAFGGSTVVTTYSKELKRFVESTQPRTKNAYMLIYKRAPIQSTIQSQTVASAAVKEPQALQISSDSMTSEGGGEPSLQRVVDLVKIRELNRSESTPSDQTLAVPSRIRRFVWEDNMQFLQTRHIFNSQMYEFMLKLISSLETAPNMAYDPAVDPTKLTLLSDQILSVATTFAFDILARGRNTADIFSRFTEVLRNHYKQSVPLCRWFLSALSMDNRWIVECLLECPFANVRKEFSTVLTTAFSVLSSFEKEIFTKVIETDSTQMDQQRTGLHVALVPRVMDIFVDLLELSTQYWKNFSEFFSIFYWFANASHEHRSYLMQVHTIAKLIDLYLEDYSPFVGTQNAHFGIRSSRKPRYRMGNKFSDPDFYNLLSAVSTLVVHCSTDARSGSSDQHMENEYSRIPPTTRFGPNQMVFDLANPVHVSDRKALLSRAFYTKSMDCDGYIEPLSTVVIHWSWMNEEFSKSVIQIVLDGFSRSSWDSIKPFCAVTTAVLDIKDSLQSLRVETLLNAESGLLGHMFRSRQKREKFTYVLIKFVLRLVEENESVGRFMSEHTDSWVWMEAWLEHAISTEGTTPSSSNGSLGPVTLCRQESGAATVQELKKQYQKAGGRAVHRSRFAPTVADPETTVEPVDAGADAVKRLQEAFHRRTEEVVQHQQQKQQSQIAPKQP
eukprot:GILK01013886.1.p1 GENE.GILK01013886.1~~GILK01013886.1.p1  ORF type:complete len:1111 (+),score=235.56 GILK01013886.1:584-3916(+)